MKNYQFFQESTWIVISRFIPTKQSNLTSKLPRKILARNCAFRSLDLMRRSIRRPPSKTASKEKFMVLEVRGWLLITSQFSINLNCNLQIRTVAAKSNNYQMISLSELIKFDCLINMNCFENRKNYVWFNLM